MTRALSLLLILLPGCTTRLVSCDNAARVRAAASLAMQVLDRACPISLETTR